MAGGKRVKSGTVQSHTLTCTNDINVMEVSPNPMSVRLHESCVSETFWSAIVWRRWRFDKQNLEGYSKRTEQHRRGLRDKKNVAVLSRAVNTNRSHFHCLVFLESSTLLVTWIVFHISCLHLVRVTGIVLSFKSS